MPTIVGSKGQIVIEKPIRDRLRVAPGAVAIQTLVDDRVEIRFIPPDHTESLFGILAKHTPKDVPAREWIAIKEQAWQAAARMQEERTTLPPASASRRVRRVPLRRGMRRKR
ncbi:MAG: AbrB/MazE/SpoVT family DNA-binding domain-containing protein [Armatimonadota bacterium]